jgi:hypothetical protein
MARSASCGGEFDSATVLGVVTVSASVVPAYFVRVSVPASLLLVCASAILLASVLPYFCVCAGVFIVQDWEFRVCLKPAEVLRLGEEETRMPLLG